MTKKIELLSTLTLKGLQTASAQTYGSVRIVPLRRQHVRDDVRIGLRRHEHQLNVTALGGATVDDVFRGQGAALIALVPHATIIRVAEHGTPLASMGTQLLRHDDDIRTVCGFPVHTMHRLVKGDVVDGEHRVRFAPLHLAIEQLLSMAFAGPEIDWPEIAKGALRHGLGTRSERVIGGRGIAGLDEALRTFELYDDQVGVAVFVAGVLAGISVVPHPDDWRAMHTALLDDMWSPLFAYAASTKAHTDHVRFDASRVRDLSTLEAELARAHVDDAHLQQALLGDVLERPVQSTRLRTIGALSLQRFHTDLQRGQAHHVGEVLVRDDGTIEYLKTFRLSDAQSHRAHLLQTLAKAQFKLVDSALALHCSPEQLVDRIQRAGFAHLFRADVLARYVQTGEVVRR
ncbi:MAG TPA: hypothetical protein VGF99_16370 [Myxococcota bacterium]